MKWTKEKPTEPGWYWYREPGPDMHNDAAIVCLWEGSFRSIGIDFGKLPSDMLGEFYGPIKYPQ